MIPNRDLVSKPIVNWGGGRYSVGFEFNITVGYGADPVVVEDLLRNIVEGHPMVLRVPGVVIRFDEFAENGMLFFVRGFISSRKVREQWDIQSQIRFQIIAKLRELKISIPFPQRVIHYAKEGGVTGAYDYKRHQTTIEVEQEESEG